MLFITIRFVFTVVSTLFLFTVFLFRNGMIYYCCLTLLILYIPCPHHVDVLETTPWLSGLYGWSFYHEQNELDFDRNYCCTNRWNNCFEYLYTLHGNSMLPFILVKSPCPPDNIQLWKFTVRHPLLFKHSMFFVVFFIIFFFTEQTCFCSRCLKWLLIHPDQRVPKVLISTQTHWNYYLDLKSRILRTYILL